MNVNLIGVPTNHGCDRNGAQYGPKKLREANIVNIMKKSELSIYDMGDIYVEDIREKDKFLSDKNIKYYNSIYNVNLNLAHMVYTSLNNKDFPIIIGGDHSIALGSISGASSYFKNLGVVWIDAHGDFNTEIISESKNSHGMPLAFLCGYGDERLVNLYRHKTKLKEENVFHIGGRDIDIEERKLLNTTKVSMYDKTKINELGIENIIHEIIEKCKKQKIDAIHISLDIDFMDEDIVKGTGTRVSDGYNVEDTKLILKELINSGLVKSMDFVEFNPLLDENDETLNICTDLLEYISNLIKESK